MNVKVESRNALDIKINDYTLINGLTYRINQLPSVTKNSENNFEYDIIFQGLMYDLKRCKFFNADANDFKTELEFPLIGDLEFFLTVVRNNMRRFSIDWEVGNFPANTETKSLSFSSDNCLSALQKICQEYKVEFWIKQENGKFKIHTGAFGNTLPITLEYGKGNGLYSLSRKNVNENDVVSRLYVNGGSTNIPNEYRGFSKNLLMPNSAYLEDTALIGDIGLIEGSITFEDIYPKRTGIISALGNSVFKFVDSSMDFNLNEKEADGVTTKYLISGTTAKIHFNTGNLAGYQFEIKKGGYDHATKTFEIIPFTNEQGQKFPDENSQAFQFSVGDEYKILDIYMPQSYITNAENELLAKATEQFNLLKQPKVSYDLKTVPEFIKSLQNPIQIGDMVNVKDIALGVDKVLRVQKISKNLITDEVESIEIADAYEINFASKLILDVKEIKNVVNITKLGEINYSKLGLKTTEELKNLVFDTDGYFDSGNIKPFSIETNMLSVGSRSQQLSLSSVFRINQDGNANKVDVTAGQLFSQTLDKTWNVSALVSTIPDNDYRYVYAKASKTTSVALIYLSKNQIPFDSDVNDYYFLVGVLHSVVDGVRILSLTVGTTTISGGLVRTGIISSLDGQTSFNLNTGEIKGKITFSSGSSGYENITDKPDLSSFEQTRDYVNSTLQTDLNDLKNRADGVIESWFYSHTPTLSNLPASNWVTTEERNAHIGDTFTNMQEFVDEVTTPDAGKAWRFVKNETTGVFSWSLIANSDSTKALIEAGKAKDTADAKRRVFVSQPYPPYNVGDLWVQGNGGDIMRCKFERLSGSFVATDFEKASKYTDDTAVNNLQIGGRNLITKLPKEKSYPAASFWNYFALSEKLKEGETYILKGTIENTGGFISIGLNNFGGLNNYFINLPINTPFVASYNMANRTHFSIANQTGVGTSIFKSFKLEKGNKATDWTPAPEDVDSAILTAQNSANTANNLLADISNDNILSPSEKQSTKKEWDIIVGEKSVVESQANTLGVSTTSYVNAYNSLNSYITPLLANLTVNSTIVGSDFRANFKNYYDAKIALLKAVTDKLKSNTDNIQVGGRNLVIDSTNPDRLPLYGVDATITKVIDNNLSKFKTVFSNITRTVGDLVFYIPFGNYPWMFSQNLTYVPTVISFYMRTNSEQVLTGGGLNVSVNSDWKKIEFTHTYGGSGNAHFYLSGADLQWIEIHSYKIERGNKATDWTPAPEDIQLQIDAESAKVINLEHKTDFLTGTTVEGNAIATGTLLVGNSDGTNAGITGLGSTSDGVYLWGGGTYQQMVQGLAKKEQRRNGIDIWRHPNGQIGFEIGIKDGRLIFNGYHSSGFKLFELDPNRGLIAVAYTQESWTETPFRKLNYSSSTFDESTITNEIKLAIIKQSKMEYYTPPPHTPDSEFGYTTTYNLSQNAVGYDYDNGTNPANSSYESLKGMKANYGDRNTNMSNGWYVSSIGEIHMETEWNSYPPMTYTFTVYVYYYQDGKITQTKVVTITK